MLIRPVAEATFDDTDIALYDINGEPWVRGAQIAAPLGVGEKTIKDIIRRHRAEFGPAETAIVLVATPGGAQQARIFSDTGIMKLCMLVRSDRAAQFRSWAVEVLTGRRAATVAGAARDAALIAAQRALMERPDWRRIKRYVGMGLTGREIAKLTGGHRETVRRTLLTMRACGVIGDEIAATTPARPALFAPAETHDA